MRSSRPETMLAAPNEAASNLVLFLPVLPAALAVACGGGNDNLPPPPPPPRAAAGLFGRAGGTPRRAGTQRRRPTPRPASAR